MIRPLLSLKRLFFDETKGKVRYQYDRQGSQEELMDYLEFIARVTSHIPDKGQVMVRYYGLYSNAHRGKIRKAGVSPFHPPIIEGEYHVPSRGWAEMIRHLKISFQPERPPPSQVVQQELLVAAEQWSEYF